MIKKILLITSCILLITGCSSDELEEYKHKTVTICGEKYSYYELDERDFDEECNEYYKYIVSEAVQEINYDKYCEELGISDRTECLEVFRDDVTQAISDRLG